VLVEAVEGNDQVASIMFTNRPSAQHEHRPASVGMVYGFEELLEQIAQERYSYQWKNRVTARRLSGLRARRTQSLTAFLDITYSKLDKKEQKSIKQDFLLRWS
jgi:hypothetical protein